MVGEVEAGPIVETGSSAGFFVDVEGEGVDEVEGGAGGDAGSADGSGVVGDLGVEEDDMGDGVLRGGLCGCLVGHGWGVIDLSLEKKHPVEMSRRGVVGFGWVVDASLLVFVGGEEGVGGDGHRDDLLELIAERVALPADDAVG